MSEIIKVPIIEADPTSNGWSEVKIKCLKKDCETLLILNVLFEDGYAAATKEDQVVCDNCGQILRLADHLRLQ